MTCTLKFKVPKTVGVPLSPPPVESVTPAGKDPETRDHAYGGVPPLAVSEAEYAVDIAPGANVDVTMLKGVAATVKVREAVADCFGVSLS